MKPIFKILLLELKQLFFSPIAWLVFIAFEVQMGSDFVQRTNFLWQTREVTSVEIVLGKYLAMLDVRR